ncbi:hypothetical protein MKW94_019659 [Papaver nudicaule]|uniref:DC1 domain-containing protein n=1 Tax=Papaver nudicaule TaxID=74823 RepID=A0AA41UW21_PAPNU|nr:hypothetical protein [Papaver nudicaule]
MSSHFTHRRTLDFVNRSSSFVCKGCDLEGSGDRYECAEFCDWDLHQTCKTCPYELSTHTHPDHKLSLYWAKGYTNEHQVKGRLYYSCETCSSSGTGFFLHPTCSTYPSRIKHALDNDHYLTCRLICPDWHYRCDRMSLLNHSKSPNGSANILPYVGDINKTLQDDTLKIHS